MRLTIHTYTAEDFSLTVVPDEDELHEAVFRAQWHRKHQRSQTSETERAHEAHMRYLEHFAADCAVLRPVCEVWTFDFTMPAWETINRLAEDIPQERRTVDRVTSALLPEFLGMNVQQLNEIPVPVLLKIKQEIWFAIRPITPGSTDYRCVLDYLLGEEKL